MFVGYVCEFSMTSKTFDEGVMEIIRDTKYYSFGASLDSRNDEGQIHHDDTQ